MSFFIWALFCLIQNEVSAKASSHILKMDIGSLRRTDGKLVVLKYIDMPYDKTSSERVLLNCKMPLAGTRYHWKFDAKIGTPEIGNIGLKDIENPPYEWERSISISAYPWDLMLVTCEPRYKLEAMIIFVWVILRMKSSNDAPYHPIICEYPEAECWANKYNCYVRYGERYMGRANRTETGKFCQPWFWYGHERPNVEKYKDREEEDDTRAMHDTALLRGFRNYCRNYKNERTQTYFESDRYQPYCRVFDDGNSFIYATDNHQKRIWANTFSDCDIPRCTHCKFGDGMGKYLDFPTNKKWSYPKFSGNGFSTKYFFIDENGKSRNIKCHQGKTHTWKRNFCHYPNKFYGRESSFFHKPSCLGIKKPRASDTASQWWEHPTWSRLEWLECDAPQCLVRQVWFLFIDGRGEPQLRIERGTFFEMDVHLDQSTVIKFYHFGTTHCKGFTIDGDNDVKSYLTFLQVDCKNTPLLSFIRIAKVKKELNGNYILRYTFNEGNAKLQPVVYETRFRLIVKEPTAIQVSSISFCPGYPTTISLFVTGSYIIDGNDVKWYYSRDKSDWNDLDDEIDDTKFSLGSDGFSLLVKKATEKLYFKVTAISHTGQLLETSGEAEMLGNPQFKVNVTVLEISYDASGAFQLIADMNLETRFVFNNLEIDKKKEDKSYYIQTKLLANDQKMEILTIKKMSLNTEGIYTIEAKKNGCRSERRVHVSLKD